MNFLRIVAGCTDLGLVTNNPMRGSLATFACFTLLLATIGSARAVELGAISVHESAGATLNSWPSQGGFPVAQGILRDSSRVRLVAQGKAIPTQARVSSRWPDGSARWLLLDWQSDLPAQQISTFKVEEGVAVATGKSIKIQESAKAIEVDTGALRFRVPKDRPGLFEEVAADGGAILDGPLTCFLTMGDRRIECGAPTQVRILEPGPLRVRLEIRGHFGERFDYIVRIDAYAGKSFVRLFHTFEQHSAEEQTEVRQIALALPLKFDQAPTYRVGIEHAQPHTGTLDSKPLHVLQLDNEEFKIGEISRPGHAAGWVSIAAGTRGIGLAARDFWQEYPKSFELTQKKLIYHLWAPQGRAAKIGSGAAKTHEVVLDFGETNQISPAIWHALAKPSPAFPEPSSTIRSRAMRNAVPHGPETSSFLQRLDASFVRSAARADREEWDDSGQALCPVLAKPVRRRGFYGMWNWGDWNYPGFHDDTKGCDAWGNLEYDRTQVLALAFAATGKVAYAEAMIASARHFMDVDTIHYSADHPKWVGMNHPKNPLHFSFALGGIDLGHTWTEGLLSYYELTGDERALEAAKGIADHLVARIRHGLRKGNPRQWGWPMIALVAMYETSGDETYRKAALDYATAAISQHPPAPISHWKLGILAEALTYVDSVHPDPNLRDWLVRYAAALNEFGGIVDPRLLPALAYVGKATKHPEYLKIARTAAQELPFGHWEKPFTIAGRVGFSVLSTLP